jgi:tetratricopeptide (TPR) repeat protein
MVLPAGAHAQNEAQKKQQAKEHYEKATRFYDVGKYEEAINEYEAAYLLIEDAALLFNIGQAYRLWDKPEEAMRSYKNYLRRRPDASNRVDVEKKIADLDRLIDSRRKESTAPAALPPPLPAPAPSPAQPEPLPPAVPTQPEATVPPAQAEGATFVQAAPSAPPPAQSNWLSYTLIGVGSVCLLTTVIAASVGASKANKLQSAAQNRQIFDPAVESNGKTANGIAWVSAVAGLATGGVGAYLLWRSHRTTAATASVAPVITSQVAGGFVQLAF